MLPPSWTEVRPILVGQGVFEESGAFSEISFKPRRRGGKNDTASRSYKHISLGLSFSFIMLKL